MAESPISSQSCHATLTESLASKDEQADLPWWKTTVIYQIYPRSFMDSNGDGIGDLRGIISRLDHFVYLGVETLWLSPFYKSPQADFGYDVSDYKDVDSIFGTLEDFRDLVKECKKRHLRLLIDFVPNHTSTEHEWFQRSLKKDGKYKDFYVWSDGKVLPDGSRARPNNWLSVFGGPAWTWSEERQQYYYHAFLPEQADLNFRNPDVVEEMSLTIRYWLDHGVDGFRVDAIANLYESENVFQDNPRSGKDVPSTEWEYLTAVHTDYLLPECQNLIMHWQKLFDDVQELDGRERFMVLEFYTDSKTRADMARYGAHPFNMDLVEKLSTPLSAKQMMGLIALEYTDKPPSYWPTFVVGNHDRKRVSTKFGSLYVNAFNLLLMALKGTPTTYYGEEIGMEDIHVDYEDTQDPWGRKAGPDRFLEFSRDFCRTPMQWTPDQNAGFTTAQKPWLPVSSDHTFRNVQNQKQDPNSHLNRYKDYVALRTRKAFKYGEIDLNCLLTDNVLSFLRFSGSERYLVAINFGQIDATNDFSVSPVNASTGTVVTDTAAASSELTKGQLIHLQELTLRAGEGVVIEL
ncbi:neutral and basic amino acid transport protein rbat [Plakobranchus ocellatus]|uniref:Neutral and basic amino acid transport protein rbat n=1 Tax=Plakobranchus ocellatus TaxID=259542 RepID=A0AAV4ASP8_9GAST|nr:neutral and basic amino acid transport protein rbat [Plakobranchus ocellatus]